MSPDSWGEDCPGGTPVPATGRCAAVDCDSVRLLSLAEGERGRVTCLEDPGSRGAAKLAALGVLPGIELVLVQRSPAFVFRIGYAELAVDEALAGLIRVRR
jgi:ferrous iron transport protein A